MTDSQGQVFVYLPMNMDGAEGMMIRGGDYFRGNITNMVDDHRGYVLNR